jgi:MFS family permease
MNPGQAPERSRALRFVVLMGFVSLFADMTYEGARSVTGPFLATLGASAFAVGLVAGLGELAGWALRLVTGWLADKNKRYWLWTIAGYGVNVLAVPALALAGSWPLAAVLLTLERVGKAIRGPAKDTLLSFARDRVGSGWTYALHEAMDQAGAVLGPVLVAAVLFFQKGSYPFAFAILLAPAVVTLALVLVSRFAFPDPGNLAVKKLAADTSGLHGKYWWYVGGMALIAFGFADFPLAAYHFQKTGLADAVGISLLYALAMGVDAVAALVFGALYDRRGKVSVVVAAAVSALFAPLVFLGGTPGMVAGVVLWGVGMGWMESVAKSVVADLSSPDRRAGAFGVFHAVFGVAWFAGSALLGWLYDVQPLALAAVSAGCQLVAIPVLIVAFRRGAER